MATLNYWDGTGWQAIYGGSVVAPGDSLKEGPWRPVYESYSNGGDYREGSGRYFQISGSSALSYVAMHWSLEVLREDIDLLRDDEPLLVEGSPYYSAASELFPAGLSDFLKHTPAQAHAAWDDGSRPMVGALRCFFTEDSYFLVYDLKTLSLGSARSVWLSGSTHTYTRSYARF